MALCKTVVLLLSLSTSGVLAALQGLYAVQAPSGQLVRIDWTTGAKSSIGAPLTDAGWSVEPCAPSTVHPTYKLYFTLARNATQSSIAAHHLLQISLGDGEILSAQALPDVFSPSMSACDHAMSIDDTGFRVHVSAVTGGPAEQLLSMSALEFKKGTDVSEVSVSLSSLALGGEVAAPCSSYTDLDGDARLWHQLEMGAAGGSVQSHSVDRTLTSAGTFCPLQFWNSEVYGVLRADDGYRVASFDPQVAVPSLKLSGRMPAPAKGGNAAVLLWQEQRIALLAGTSLITVDLQGNVASNVTACDTEVAMGMGCFSSMAYQPNVFVAV